MEKKYSEVCERISKIEHSKGAELTEQQIDYIWFYRKAMKNSLVFIAENPDNELCEQNKNTFNLYHNRLVNLLDTLG